MQEKGVRIMSKLKENMHSLKNVCFFVKRAFKLNPLGILVKIPEIVFQVMLKFIPIIFLKEVLNQIQLHANEKTVLLYIVLYSALLLVCQSLISWIHISSERHTSKINRVMRMDLTKQINKLTYSDVEKPETRTFLQMLEDDISITDLLNSATNIVMELLVLCGVIGIICTLQPVIVLLILSVLLVRTFINNLTRLLWNKWRVPVNEKMRRVNYLLNVLKDSSYGKEIRINGLQNWVSAKMAAAEEEYLRTMNDYNRQIQIRNAFVEVAVILQEVVIYLLLAYRVFFKGLLVGDYSMYISSISSFSSSFASLINSFSEILKSGDFLALYRDMCEKKEPDENIEDTEIPTDITINFNHVYFTYPNTSKLILNDICLEIKSRQSLSIIGTNGAGKTTIIKLLCRLYKPTCGTITLNDKDIFDIPIDLYKKTLGVLFQDFKLFSFSVADNISLSSDYNAEALYDVLSKCELKEKVESLPKKENTSIGRVLDSSGVEFSGGECQRIGLCRLLYKSPDVVILDEPTASLDPFKEYELYKMMYEYTKDKCSIFISHRLASTRFTDKIAVIKDGRVAELGTFDELLKLDSGVFRELYEMQSGYYLRM